MLKKILAGFALITLTNFSFAQMIMTQPVISSLLPKKDYIPLNIPSNKTLANPVNGKPLVIEFFWYGCSHCYHMEPLVKKLIADRKSDFTFKRYPVMFPRWESGAQLYFTLEEMGLVEKLHDKVFTTIQEKRVNILDDKKLRDAFLKAEGIDIIKFDSVYNSFSINSKMMQAKANTILYKIDSSPSFVINNAYLVNPGLNTSYEKTIIAMNKILDTVKK